jgi:hypothetical protein
LKAKQNIGGFPQPWLSSFYNGLLMLWQAAEKRNHYTLKKVGNSRASSRSLSLPAKCLTAPERCVTLPDKMNDNSFITEINSVLSE